MLALGLPPALCSLYAVLPASASARRALVVVGHGAPACITVLPMHACTRTQAVPNPVELMELPAAADPALTFSRAKVYAPVTGTHASMFSIALWHVCVHGAGARLARFHCIPAWR